MILARENRSTVRKKTLCQCLFFFSTKNSDLGGVLVLNKGLSDEMSTNRRLKLGTAWLNCLLILIYLFRNSPCR